MEYLLGDTRYEVRGAPSYKSPSGRGAVTVLLPWPWTQNAPLLGVNNLAEHLILAGRGDACAAHGAAPRPAPKHLFQRLSLTARHSSCRGSDTGYSSMERRPPWIHARTGWPCAIVNAPTAGDSLQRPVYEVGELNARRARETTRHPPYAGRPHRCAAHARGRALG